MRKHLNNLYVQYVLTAIFCFGFFCVPPHIFFLLLDTLCFLTVYVSWHLCFLTLVFLNTLGFWRQRFVYLFFLETVFFFFFVPFFFSRVFLFLIISREHHICMILGFVFFFFFFFFFSRQLICENTSITRIYINNRQILVRFFFCIYCQTYFCFLKLCVSLYLKTKFWTSFFFSRRCISVFHGFFFFFFFWTIFVGVFDISKFSACFSFFFFFLLFFYCWD